MKPTFSLSAADALKLSAATDTAAAAAHNNIFLIVRLQFETGSFCFFPRTRRPSRAPTGDSAVGYEHHSERRGRGRAGRSTRARDQDEDDDRREIRQRRHQLRRNAKAQSLGMQLQDGDSAEKVSAADQPD